MNDVQTAPAARPLSLMDHPVGRYALIGALAGMAFPALLTCIATFALHAYPVEPPWLIRLLSILLAFRGLPADLLAFGAHVVPALLLAVSIDRTGQVGLSKTGKIALGLLLMGFVGGLVGLLAIDSISPGNVHGGAEALDRLSAGSSLSLRLSGTYLALLFGLKWGGFK